jgi:hypothetical protein
MAVKLHRCGGLGKLVKIQAHPCWRVESALQEKGIAYDPVYGPLSTGKRTDVEQLSGQRRYPVIEFEDGSAYREESKDMRATILDGRLDEKRATGGQAGTSV